MIQTEIEKIKLQNADLIKKTWNQENTFKEIYL